MSTVLVTPGTNVDSFAFISTHFDIIVTSILHHGYALACKCVARGCLVNIVCFICIPFWSFWGDGYSICTMAALSRTHTHHHQKTKQILPSY